MKNAKFYKNEIELIDFHSHIIYGVDDGAKDEEMTVKMLKTAIENGTKRIVATPHFLKGNFTVNYGEINIRVEEIKELVNRNNLQIEVYCGQEVYYTNYILDMYKSGDIGTINNSRYMLIELPMGDFNIGKVIDNIYELQIKGIIPILAHPERYQKLIKKPELINMFVNEGFLAQLNIGSIMGNFGKAVRKTAEIFVNNRIYSVIGSDAHGVEERTTDIKLGILEIDKLQQGYMLDIHQAGENILNNEETNFLGQPIKKKNVLSRLLRK
ncbi:MAG: CpsB/CapC family capsule biosynthesis tyrosine phosphatase [Clostridium sp.]|uniref:tyrosine-protein phosphatase n=1 Tax=Clostridium sp. TaxID=1506 RepID=UPI00305D6F1B